jgi:hypothetical protein
MSESKDLLLVIEQLQRSNRRWKRLALAACSVLVILVLIGFVSFEWQRMRLEAQRRAANEALFQAQMAAQAGQPR